MKTFTLATVALCLFGALFLTGCEKETNTDSQYIEGLSLDNYPVIDGSTSTLPLNMVVACELLGLGYEWQENEIDFKSSTWSVEPQVKSNVRKKMNGRILSSQTHNSFINVIDDKVDIALTARKMSPDEQAYAESKGVTLIETPIALDAFVFIVNAENPIKGLTTKNIQDIYTGQINDWKEFGVEIHPGYSGLLPYIRNANSGSQELMDELIMKGLVYTTLPIYEEALVFTMMGMLDAVGGDPYAMGYTIYYYNEYIVRPGKQFIKTIAVDGVQPNTQTITDRSYPYTTEVYAVIRSDMDKTSMPYKVYRWLQTAVGKRAIALSGYIPTQHVEDPAE